jgi:hypothetical protein
MGINVVTILAAFVLLVVLGLWYFVKDREMVSGDRTIIKATDPSITAPRRPDEQTNPAVQSPPPALVQPIPAPVISPKN